MIMDVLETVLFSAETPMLTVAAAAAAAAGSCNEASDVSGMKI